MSQITKAKKKKHKPSWKRIIQLFFAYTFLFVTLFLFIDYIDFYAIDPVLLIIISFVLGVIFTFVHISLGHRSRIDDIADKL